MSVRIPHIVGAIIASFVFHSPARSALTLDDALRLAQARSQQLAAQESSTAAAREMAVAAGQRPDPSLRIGVNNLPLDGEDRFSLNRDFMTMRSIGVMQEFTRADKRRARAARFEREADVAQAGREATLANLQRETALAWLERHFQERVRAVLVQQRDESKLQLEAAQATYRGGRGSQADVFSARSALAQMDDRIAQSERDIVLATIHLTRWIGEAGSGPLAVAPAMEILHAGANDIHSRLAQHPEITAMIKQEAVAQSEFDLAKANRRADWSVELMYSQRGSSYSDMVSLNFSIPIQWDRNNRQNRELAAKLALVQQVRAQREEVTREHLAQAQAMVEEWRRDRERLTRYDATLIPLVVERTRAAIAAYRGGGGTLKSVLEGRREELDVRMERLRLESAVARRWAQINYLIPAGK